jgi:hypothetical protein
MPNLNNTPSTPTTEGNPSNPAGATAPGGYAEHHWSTELGPEGVADYRAALDSQAGQTPLSVRSADEVGADVQGLARECGDRHDVFMEQLESM